MPCAIFFGGIYGNEWAFNIGIAACVIMMLLATVTSVFLLVPIFVPNARPSTKEIENIRQKWTLLRRVYALFKALIMVFILAGVGWVATSVCYFQITLFSWFVVYLLLASEKKNTCEVTK